MIEAVTAEQKYVHAVQYMTCDQNCVVIAGFMSDTVRRVWRADMKDVISLGDGGEGVSSNKDCNGVDTEGLWFRVNVCFREANPLATDDEGGGEGGRLEV